MNSIYQDQSSTIDCPFNQIMIEECGTSFCRHQILFSTDLLSITGYILQFFLTGLASSVGLGGELSKQSILMTLEHYYEYEATTITYYVTFGSTLGILLFICFDKKLHFIDYDVIYLILPLCVTVTDLGNFFNRQIPDFWPLLLILIVELGFSYKLFKFTKKMKRNYKIKQIRDAESKQLINTLNEKQATISFGEPNPQVKQISSYKQIGIILVIHLVIQVIIQIRGGNKKNNKINEEYAKKKYWYWTCGIYIGSIVILFIVYKYIQQQRNKDRQNEDPNYCKKWQGKMKTFIIILGAIGCFSTAFMGVGVGLILTPSLMIIKDMKLEPLKVVYTVTFCQFLTNLSLIHQTCISIYFIFFIFFIRFCVNRIK